MSNLGKCLKTGLIAMVASGIVSIGVQAGESSSKGPVPFDQFDTDGSGFVSEEEFNTTRGQRMAAKAAEGKQMRGASSAPAFVDIDVDGDGLLSPQELAAAQKAHMAQHRGMGKGQHKGEHMGKGEGKGMGNAPCKGKGMKNKMPTFSDFDLDGDGKIVETEFNQGHTKRMSEMAAAGNKMKHAGDAPGFSGIDTNDDGEISEQEFATHQAEHHKQMATGKHQ